MSDLIIVHTNDTHGRFAPGPGGRPSPVALRLGELVADLPGCLLLDAGDAVSAGNLGFRPGGEPALDVMSGLGYHAMCLGNRETHPRREIFPRKVDRARFPVLCANVVPRGDAPMPARPSVVREIGGTRVGIFGVSVPMFTRRQWSQALCDYWFDDPIAVARKQAAQLRPEVDLLIALTHIGFRQDQALAAACPGIDLVIGGHSHTDLDEPARVGSVPVVQAWAFGVYAGVARMEPGPGRPRLVSWEKRRLRDDLPR